MSLNFIIVQDDDGHWYLIPQKYKRQFELWLNFWAEDDYDGEEFESYRIDNPSSVIIHEFTMEDEQ